MTKKQAALERLLGVEIDNLHNELSKKFTEKKFLALVKAEINRGWRLDCEIREERCHKTLKAAVIWTHAYLAAEQQLEDSARSLAEMFINGISPLETMKDGLSFWSGQAWDMESADMCLRQIRVFWQTATKEDFEEMSLKEDNEE